MDLKWAQAGEKFITDAYAEAGQSVDMDEVRGRILAQAQKAKWVAPKGSFPFSPGMALKCLAEQMRARTVNAVTHSGYLRLPDGPEVATYTLLGVDATYSSGLRLRLFALDAGGCLYPVLGEEHPVGCECAQVCKGAPRGGDR